MPWVWPPFTVHHGAFRKLKGFSRNGKGRLCIPVHREVPAHPFALFRIIRHICWEEEKELSGFSSFHPLGQPRRGCLQARSTAERRGQAGGQHVSGHLRVPCSVARSGTPCRRDLSLGAALHEVRAIHPSRGFLSLWLSTPELQTQIIHHNCTWFQHRILP